MSDDQLIEADNESVQISAMTEDEDELFIISPVRFLNVWHQVRNRQQKLGLQLIHELEFGLNTSAPAPFIYNVHSADLLQGPPSFPMHQSLTQYQTFQLFQSPNYINPLQTIPVGSMPSILPQYTWISRTGYWNGYSAPVYTNLIN